MNDPIVGAVLGSVRVHEHEPSKENGEPDAARIASALGMSDRDRARLSAGSWLAVRRPTFERYGRKPRLERPAAGQPSRSHAAAGEEVDVAAAHPLLRLPSTRKTSYPKTASAMHDCEAHLVGTIAHLPTELGDERSSAFAFES